MELKLENVRIVRGYDLGGDGPHNWADVVLLDINGDSSLEYLDSDGTLCADHDSSLRNYLAHDEADEIRERLAKWLAGPSHKVSWVSANRQGELAGWEVPHGGDIEAVKAECLREVLDQCGTDEDRRGILAGTVEVTPVAA
ncbi:hypothetical protein [Mesorhizobium sp.]|uniref:hypothetical protein n=1 Tax=Mesorhizobium sp. TaxID=1871066 RepID=UPI0025D86C69|nr:hypothetical protein [Mesorhizobium sp.]